MWFCWLQYCRSSLWPISISSVVDAKELINQTLDYYKYKINNDLCTMEEIESVSEMRKALVVIGPTTSGKEFQDSLIHEIHHLAVAIAKSLGVNLEGETPAYISGDSARELAGIVCELGCDQCRQ